MSLQYASLVGMAFDLDAYLRRIGLESDLALDHATLTQLQLNHATSIPFENLDIHLGRPILLDVPSLVAKLVLGGRGGYCFEQNTILAAALEEIGFNVDRWGARVLTGDGHVTARAHMILAVDADGERWLVDAGFGAETPLCPVPLERDVAVTCGGWRYRLVRDDSVWVLQAGGTEWTELYTFNEERHYPIDYEVANHYTSTHPSSGFVKRRTAQLPSPEMQLVLRDEILTERFPDSTSTTTEIAAADLLDVLRTRFGLAFEPGTTFRSPIAV